MSKTPLTDAWIEKNVAEGIYGQLAYVDGIAFARRLEQDRAELLEALKAVLPDLVGVTEIIANEAIAKAERA